MTSDGLHASSEAHPPDLEVSEDMAFQHRTWVVQRVAWAVLALLLTAAAVGLFSVGPLSTTTASDPARILLLDYERFLRFGAPTEMHLHLEPEATGEETITIRLSGDLARGVEFVSIQPEPDGMLAAPDGLEFEFRISDPGQPTEIFFSILPHHMGRLEGAIGLADQEPLRLSPFVYP